MLNQELNILFLQELTEQFNANFNGEVIYLEEFTVFKKDTKFKSISTDLNEKDMMSFSINNEFVKRYDYLYIAERNTLILKGELFINDKWTKVTPNVLWSLFKDRKKGINHPIFYLCEQIYGTNFLASIDTRFKNHYEILSGEEEKIKEEKNKMYYEFK